jgi:hypothetical protein
VYHDVVTDFDNIRIINDGMVFVVAFVPKGDPIPQPDWAAELPTLGAADGGNVAPSTTISGATTLVPPVPIDTTPGGSTSTSTATGDTGVGESSTTTGAVSTSTTTPATTTTGG